MWAWSDQMPSLGHRCSSLSDLHGRQTSAFLGSTLCSSYPRPNDVPSTLAQTLRGTYGLHVGGSCESRSGNSPCKPSCTKLIASPKSLTKPHRLRPVRPWSDRGGLGRSTSISQHFGSGFDFLLVALRSRHRPRVTPILGGKPPKHT